MPLTCLKIETRVALRFPVVVGGAISVATRGRERHTDDLTQVRGVVVHRLEAVLRREATPH